jgi:DNA-binding NarL/FixJ family response regulator
MQSTQKEKPMNLTERERKILELSRQGLSDYRIARKINTDPPSITRSRKNAHKKLAEAMADIEWATTIGLDISEFSSDMVENKFSFFL